MQPTIDDLTWHDGQLLSLRLEAGPDGRYSVELLLNLLDSLETQNRTKWVLRMSGLSKLSLTFDVAALNSNFNFGNIADAKVVRADVLDLWLYVADGMLWGSCAATNVSLSEVT